MLQQFIEINKCDLKFSNTEGQFSGYANVFNVLDSKNDIVMPGAFDNVIKSGNPVDLYVNHNWLKHQLPIGRWYGLVEDTKGLFGESQIVMDMPSGKDAYYATKNNLVKGLSIAAIPDEKSIERNSAGNRLIYNYKFLKEISIVDSPANEFSTITSIKFDEELKSIENIKDYERYLREAGGFTRDHAKMLVAQAKTIFGQRDAGDMESAAALQALKNRLQKFATT
jgi:uncharacterized protein